MGIGLTSSEVGPILPSQGFVISLRRAWGLTYRGFGEKGAGAGRQAFRSRMKAS